MVVTTNVVAAETPNAFALLLFALMTLSILWPGPTRSVPLSTIRVSVATLLTALFPTSKVARHVVTRDRAVAFENTLLTIRVVLLKARLPFVINPPTVLPTTKS